MEVEGASSINKRRLSSIDEVLEVVCYLHLARAKFVCVLADGMVI